MLCITTQIDPRIAQFSGPSFPTTQTDLKCSNKWEDDCLWCETISLSGACVSYLSCVYGAALLASKAIFPDEN